MLLLLVVVVVVVVVAVVTIDNAISIISVTVLRLECSV